MADVGQKINNSDFRIANGTMLGVALIISTGRMVIKYNRFHHMFMDDYLFLASVIFMIAGTICTFCVIPYNKIEVELGAGLIPPPKDITHILDLDVKLQDAAEFLSFATVFTIKLSFLFFFRTLLGRTGLLRSYWWIVIGFTIPSAIICMCTEFMVCPAFGERIYVKCVSEVSPPRQIAVLYTVVVLDIATDLLLMSIPVLILWKIRINIRRKLGLGFVLCLSMFCIITNIIRAAGHKLNNGQDDVAWTIFWGLMEAYVAVIANSMTAFRSLFHVRSSKAEKLPVELKDMKNNKGKNYKEAPTMTVPEISGLKHFLFTDPFEDRDDAISGTIMVNNSSNGATTLHNGTMSIPVDINRAG